MEEFFNIHLTSGLEAEKKRLRMIFLSKGDVDIYWKNRNKFFKKMADPATLLGDK